jgi:hypothetical protein
MALTLMLLSTWLALAIDLETTITRFFFLGG